MFPSTKHQALSTLIIMLALAPVAAYADIGGIGSPVTPSNPPEDDQQDASTKTAAPLPLKAPEVLMVLRGEHLRHFERELRESIETIQKTKPNALYQVVSYIPSGTGAPQTQQAIDDAAANLAFLTKSMQDLGVPNTQMQVDTEYSGLVTSQEIRVFVY